MPTDKKDGGSLEQAIRQSKVEHVGSQNYRAYVGPPKQFDFMGATQFRLLTALGLREEHFLVDIGCGSLRAGRLLLQYLMPGRYVGIEPHEWLWQAALEAETGMDLARLKSPRFIAESDFSLKELPDGQFDFVVAQSIYSHAGARDVRQSITAAARVMREDGQFLFTAVAPGDRNFLGVDPGSEFDGWRYPKTVSYRLDEIEAYCADAGLHVQRLQWFHPRQSWFRAVREQKQLLTPEMEREIGSGKPLFDDRFA